ncbi:MAG: esterase-like activity of phytase family protein [Bosea sp. (in: a-proteobacteria)]
MSLTRRAGLGLAASGLASLAAGTAAQARPRMDGLDSEAISIKATPIRSLMARSPDQVRFGKLNFRSGLVLTSPHPVFGGFSGLSRSADGVSVVAVSDSGHWLTARLQRDGGKLSGLGDAVLAPMLNASGRTLARTRSYDTEGLCIDGGTAYVCTERSHEIWRFDWSRRGTAARGTPLRLPLEVQDLPRNRSLEAVGVAPAASPVAGAVVALSERSGSHDEPTLGIIVGGPKPGLFRYQLNDGYEVTDLAFLGNGDMLVLERWYRPWRGVGMRLRRVAGRELMPDVRVSGELLADLDLAHEIDNMEGLAVHSESGKTILTMISDDNYSSLQRTLLLEFELA